MEQSKGWGLSRYVALFAVLALHLAILAALLASRTEVISPSADYPVQLLYLPPASRPKIRYESSRPRSLSGNTAIALTPPVLDSTSPAPSPSSAASNGSGAGVDWKAEARRAVQAFEIRSHAPQASDLLTGSPAEDWWWPRTRHNAGDQYKTPSGDWIVWISSSCYQIAVAGPSAFAPGARLPQTLCPGDSGTPRGEPPDKEAASKKPQSNR